MESAKNDYEALRAVDPGAPIESGTLAPKPGHLGVAPLVGGEWSLPEGKPYEYGEADRDAAQKWGPPREDLDRRTAAVATVGLVAALAVAVWLFGLGLTPDRYLLVLPDPAQPGAEPVRRARIPLHLGLEADRPEPVRGDSVAARRVRLPLLPLRRHAGVEDALALDRARRRCDLPALPVVRSRLHRQPLRDRPAARLHVRECRAGRRVVVLAAARPARVEIRAARQRRSP